jgi:hypothetical protein
MLENGKTSRTKLLSGAHDEQPDIDHRGRDEDEDANMIVEYLLAVPYRLDESETDYWERFRTSVGFTHPITCLSLRLM